MKRGKRFTSHRRSVSILQDNTKNSVVSSKNNHNELYKKSIVKLRTTIINNKPICHVDIKYAKDKLIEKGIIQSKNTPDDIVKVMYMLIFNKSI